MTLSPLRRDGALFRDAEGRQVMLRGVNLGGDAKIPWPDGGTDHPSDFADHRTVSFIGRPFPLDEADEHLSRLKHWGFNLVRLLTTWEAVEHAGPGSFDTEYLDYLATVVGRCGAHGLYVFIDFHQDVWSRMSGGDGAPGWVFEAVGLDFTRFDAAGAAHVMQRRFDYGDPNPQQPAYPRMSWGSNYRLPANGIMWTLFWAGRLFTPDFTIAGVNVQEFLQGHYLGAIDQVARRVAAFPHVLGFDTLNEPGTGWLGESLTYRHLAPTAQNRLKPRPGPALSVLDQLAIARGVPTRVPWLRRNPETGNAEPAGEQLLNRDGVSIWRDGSTCPFERAGAYRLDGGRAAPVDEAFFQIRHGRRLDLSDDGYRPLFRQVAETTRRHRPDWLVFAELDPWGAAAGRKYPRDMPARCVNAGHWYDAGILYLKRFDPEHHYDFITGAAEHGPDQIRRRYIAQLGARHRAGADLPGGAPTLIGEFGIPFDLDDGAAYAAWAAGKRDVWDKHVLALALMYDALDALQLHSAQWNYTASNRNAGIAGDGWNQEDLSIFSRDQQDDPADPDSGGRAVPGFCRPYARRIQGTLLRVAFDWADSVFTLEYEADPAIPGPTEIYLPRIQFPYGFEARLDGAEAEMRRDPDPQLLKVASRRPGRLSVTVRAK